MTRDTICSEEDFEKLVLAYDSSTRKDSPFQVKEQVSGKVQFVSVGQLLPYVLFLAPVLNSCLMDLAQQVYNAISPIADTKISKYYRPFSWLPHITLGKTLSTEEMQCAFAVVQSHFSVFDGFITEIGVAKVNPHIDVLRYRLQ